MSHSVLEANTQAGVALFGAADATLSDTEVRLTQAPRAELFGFGVAVYGGRAELRDLALTANHAIGLLVHGAGTQADGERVTVRDTRLHALQDVGAALYVEQGASAAFRAASFPLNRRVAVQVSDPGSRLALAGAIVHGTQSGAERYGTGFTVSDGASGELTDVALVGNLGFAAIATDAGSRLHAAGLVALDTDGIGLHVDRGAEAVLSRSVFANSVGFGVLASRPGTRLALTDTLLREIRARGRSSDAIGLAGASGARVEASRFAIVRSDLFGAFFEDEAVLSQGWITATRAPHGQPHGSALQVQGASASLTSLAI
ncbi:MAG: hypothetical protein ACK4N5_25455, partial [Myxococcales bacterium]